MKSMCKLAALACVMLAMPLTVQAQTAPAAFLQGTWALKDAYEIKPDGSFIHPYGAAPQGVLMVDSQGRYVVEIYSDSRVKFPATGATPDDYKAAFTAMSVHTGFIESDPSGVLVFHMQHNANPTLDGSVQKRPYQLTGHVLSYRIPPAAEGKSNTPVSVWQRLN